MKRDEEKGFARWWIWARRWLANGVNGCWKVKKTIQTKREASVF